MDNLLGNIIPSLAGVVLAITYFPQIVQTIKTKDVSGLSLSFWVLLVIAISMLFINSVYTFVRYGDWGYMLTEAANLSLAIVMLILVVKYRKN